MKPRKPTQQELEDIFAPKERNLNMREIHEPLEWFKQQMEIKLRKNDFKGGWDKDTVGELFYYLVAEVDELFNAITNNEPPENVIFESADVGNFAMMIADLMRKKMRSEATDVSSTH